MKKYGITIVAMIFALSTVMMAQQPQRPNQKARQGERKEMRQENKEKLTPQKRAGYMAVDLELTDAQRKKLEVLFEKQDKQREEHRAEMAKLREEQLKKMHSTKHRLPKVRLKLQNEKAIMQSTELA